MFTDNQKAELTKKLQSKHVSKHPYNGFDYIKGWHAIAEANRIFGFDGWSCETVMCREVCRYETKVNRGNDDGWKVGYEAKVRVQVKTDISPNVVIREGTGSGCSSKQDLFDAIEGAVKEAETDAIKRALRTFGNQFGLALYDETKANVISYEYLSKVSKGLRKAINACKTPGELGDKLEEEKVLNALEELKNDDDLYKGLTDCIECKEASFT